MLIGQLYYPLVYYLSEIKNEKIYIFCLVCILIDSLPGNLKAVALMRLQHPNLSNKQIADTLGVSYNVVVNSFFKIGRYNQY